MINNLFHSAVKISIFILSTIAILAVAFFAIAWWQFESRFGVLAPPQTQIPATEKVKIIVANRRMETDTRLEEEHFRSAQWPIKELPDGAIPIEDAQKFIGKYLKEMVRANSPILKENLVDVLPLREMPRASAKHL